MIFINNNVLDNYKMIRNGSSMDDGLNGLKMLQNICRVSDSEITDSVINDMFMRISNLLDIDPFSYEELQEAFARANFDIPLNSVIGDKNNPENKLINELKKANFEKIRGIIYNVSMELLYQIGEKASGKGFSFSFDNDQELEMELSKLDVSKLNAIPNIQKVFPDLEEFLDLVKKIM